MKYNTAKYRIVLADITALRDPLQQQRMNVVVAIIIALKVQLIRLLSTLAIILSDS